MSARLLGLWLGALAAGCGRAMPPSQAHGLVGAGAPTFWREAIDEREVGLPGADRTRATVIDFWASWCAACEHALPALDALYRERKEEGVMVIGINVGDEEREARAFVQRVGIHFPVVLDGDRIAASYRIRKVPLTFVVDAAGRVRWVGRDPALVEQAVDALLAEGPPRSSALVD